MNSLILASSSKYRQNLLSRLAIKFDSIPPQVDETPLKNESAEDLAIRLSELKARTISNSHPDQYVLGSDQVASHNDQIIGKPITYENAFNQLKNFSGDQVSFITGVTLINKSINYCQTEVSIVKVEFRELSAAEIESYLNYDKPFDCAGSFKVESLGISLFESVQSNDPTSLEGLPLISVCRLFRSAGINLN